MNNMTRNVTANFLGQGFSAAIQLMAVPIVVNLLGIEAYGLVGFYLTLQAVLQVLDLGISPTMNREMARHSVQSETSGQVRDLVRTLEVLYWGIGLAIGATIAVSAPWVAVGWLKSEALSSTDIQQAVTLMGGLATLQWPLTFYQSGLLGLQKQALLSGLQVVTSLLTNCGAILVLLLMSPSIVAYLYWQILASAVRIAIVTACLWRSLPSSDNGPRVNMALVRRTWRFAAGMTGITASGIIIAQADKLVLSKLLSLETFGYYMLAWTIVSGLTVIVVPVFNAALPRLTALATMGITDSVSRTYHQCSQLITVLVLPAAGLLVLFSYDVVFMWTGNSSTAHSVAPIVRILAIGSTLNSLMVLPYSLQLAHGWTSLGLKVNVLLVLAIIPTLLVLAVNYGPEGAAAAWAISNGLYLAIGGPLTHRRLLTAEGWRWAVEDICFPLAGAVGVLWVAQLLITTPMSQSTAIIALPTAALSTMLAATLGASRLRILALAKLSRYAIHKG